MSLSLYTTQTKNTTYPPYFLVFAYFLHVNMCLLIYDLLVSCAELSFALIETSSFKNFMQILVNFPKILKKVICQKCITILRLFQLQCSNSFKVD